MSTEYYRDKIDDLCRIFGATDIKLEPDTLVVDGARYPVIEDVIVVLDPSQYPAFVRGRLSDSLRSSMNPVQYAEEIQYHYTRFWEEWSGVLPYHEREFNEYYDLVDLSSLNGAMVMDAGCGMGRWSYMLSKKCDASQFVLVDFSEAIFTARQLMKDEERALFIMADLTKLPFKEGFADFIMALGVLHHLPVNCLDAVRDLGRFAPRLLVYLYYALDNKPFYYRWLLRAYTPVRLMLCKVRSQAFRVAFSWFGLIFIYLPFIILGTLLKPFGLSRFIPLYNEHAWAGLEGMRHSVYDRFFTLIEQRVSRVQIKELEDTFDEVRIADGQAYWHFLCTGLEVNRNPPMDSSEKA